MINFLCGYYNGANDMIKVLIKYIYHFLIGAMLLFLVYFIWKIGFGIPSSYTDLSFHLSTAQGFARAGGITTWDFWESLPLGRPHNYPPLFHLVLASIMKTGLSPSIAVKVMMELTVVGGLAIYAWGLTKIFDIRVAFWSVFLLFLSSHFVQLSATVMPATIVTFLVPALLYFALEKKWLSYSLTLIIMFYLHLYMPYFVLFSLLIYIIFFQKKIFKSFLLFSSIAFVAYLPWLIHILLGGWSYIKYLDSSTAPDMWKGYTLVNLLVVMLTIGSTLTLIFKRKKISEHYSFFLIIAIVMLAPSFMVASRVLNSHFLVFAAVLSTIAIIKIWESHFQSLLAIPFVFYCWLTPILITGTKGETNDISFSPVFMTEIRGGTYALYLAPSTINVDNFLLYRTGADPAQRFSPIINAINRKANPGDTITTIATGLDGDLIDKNYQLSISNIFASYTNLATLNLRQPEIYHKPLPDITRSKYLITNLSTIELNSTFFSNMGYSNSDELADFVKDNFQAISYISSDFDIQTTLYCLYNTATTEREQIPNHRFPLYAGDGLLVVFIGIIYYENRKTKKHD